jgi:hypothetical protein
MTDVDAYLGVIVQACAFTKYLDHANIKVYTPNCQWTIFFEDNFLRVLLWEGQVIQLSMSLEFWTVLSGRLHEIPGEVIHASLSAPGRMAVRIRAS